MTEYRFSVVDTPYQSEPTIYRGRLFNPRERGWDTSEEWTHYWDSDGMVAFYDEGYRGCRIVTGTDEEAGLRAIRAYEAEVAGETGAAGGILRLAERLTSAMGSTGDNTRCWVEVALDRGMTLVALCWDRDNADDWKREIEAVWNGEVYRIEVEEYQPGMGALGSDWVITDDGAEQYYGEQAAEAGFAKEFPLTEFPAEQVLGASTD